MAEQNERQPPVVRDPRVPKFPVIYAAPTFEQVKSNISTNDLVQWAVLGSACFPLGYMVGKQLDRNLARPAMLFTGVMGCIGGALLSYQNSELRLQGFGRNHEEVARYLTPKEGESDQ
ncbi:hypothetical protein Gpo141_00001477 [Globisporangium polare]